MIEKLLKYGDKYHIEEIKSENNKNLVYIKSKTLNVLTKDTRHSNSEHRNLVYCNCL